MGESELAKYVLGERLAVHQQREVFAASDSQGRAVVLKRLQLGALSDWKTMELFEREARTLQALSHPRIPRLLNSFHAEHDGRVELSLVMERIEGPSLAQRLAQGWRPNEAVVREIARQGLEILIWLHSQQPAVIHRDIKPSNLIWTDAGELYLIDFGAVRDIFVSKGASTVIGTFGYMAPEQFAGQTEPASDLYSLGATLLHLLAGRPPAEIPQRHLMPDFRAYVSCSRPLQRWIERLLMPDVEERLPDAATALKELEALDHHREVSPSGRMSYQRDGNQVHISLQPSWKPRSLWQQYRLLPVGVVLYLVLNLPIFWILATLPWTSRDLAGTNPVLLSILGTYLIGSITVLWLVIRRIYRVARERMTLTLLPDELHLQKLAPKKVQLTIPRQAIAEVRREVVLARDKFSREGVSLWLHPTLDLPATRYDVAFGLGKPDQHWLMTKLLQYTQSEETLPEVPDACR